MCTGKEKFILITESSQVVKDCREHLAPVQFLIPCVGDEAPQVLIELWVVLCAVIPHTEDGCIPDKLFVVGVQRPDQFHRFCDNLVFHADRIMSKIIRPITCNITVSILIE